MKHFLQITNNKQDFYNAFANPFGKTLGCFVFIMLCNTYYIYQELIIKSGVGHLTVLKLLLVSTPAIIVVSTPVASVMGFMFGSSKVISENKSPYITRKVASLTKFYSLIAICLASLCFALNELIVPISNQKTVAMAKEMLLIDDKGNKLQLNFENKHSIREMNFVAALKKINHDTARRIYIPRDRIDYFLKFSLPLAIVFLLPLGMALGLLLAYIHPLIKLTHGVMVIMLWYTIYSISSNLGYSEQIPVIISAWLPNLIPFVLGTGLLWSILQSSALGIPVNFTGNKHDNCQNHK